MGLSGKCFIDQVDIFDTYGAYMAKGAFKELMKSPKRKPSLSNNWREENGEEIDLTLATYESMELSIPFHLTGESYADYDSKLEAFKAMLMADGEREMEVITLQKLFKVYYKEISNEVRYGGNNNSCSFTVKFGMNLPGILLDIDPPLAPSGISLTNVQSNSIQVNWVDNSNNEEGFEVIISTSSTFASGNLVRLASRNATSLVVPVQASTTYYVKVRAYNKLKTQYSNYTSVAQTTTSQAKLATTQLTVTSGDGQATLSWTAISLAQSYEADFHTGDSNWQPLPGYDGVSRLFLHTGLTNGTGYYYRVRSIATGYLSSDYATGLGTPQETTTGGTGTTTETVEFGAITWGSTVPITIPTGIKSHKFKIIIPSESTTELGTLEVTLDSNGVFCSGTIYNNDSVLKTVNLPENDLRGQGLLQAISIPANKALDISFKNDGTKRIWQYIIVE